jgi:hypothetical protein
MIRTVLMTVLVASAAAGPGGADAAEPVAGAELVSLPVNVSLVPPLSANALFRYRTVNAFALDLLLGNSAALRGVELSGLGSRNGEVRGLQIAGLANWVDAGAYGQTGEVRGAQLAGIVNVASATSGAQLAGILNVASATSGVQVAGVVNVASDVAGVQLAGVLNSASGRATVQVATANVARQVTGAQVGVFNVAEEADVSVGVFSWVNHGTHDLAVAATEYGVLAEADTGGRKVYGILTAGPAYGSNPRRYLLGFGIGWKPIATDSVALDVQTTAMQMVDADHWTERHLYSARAVVAVRVVGPLTAFAGPTFNTFVDREPRKIDPVGYGWKVGSDVQLWPGFLAGLRLF